MHSLAESAIVKYRPNHWKYHTLQAIFDAACIGVAKQGRRSQETEATPARMPPRCAYRGEKNCGCAIGYSLTETALALPVIKNNATLFGSVRELTRPFPIRSEGPEYHQEPGYLSKPRLKDLALNEVGGALALLQRTHDQAVSRVSFRTGMQKFAARYGLRTTVLERELTVLWAADPTWY